MFKKIILAACLAGTTMAGHSQPAGKAGTPSGSTLPFSDIPFIQETHTALHAGQTRESDEVRSIAVDHGHNAWIATAAGIFMKKPGLSGWLPVITGEERGPGYAVAVTGDGTILLGTWNGLYSYRNNTLRKETGPEPPISVLCISGSNTWAMGPRGIWQERNGRWEKFGSRISQAIRDAASDAGGKLRVATDAGIYCFDGENTRLLQDTSQLISCYAKALAYAGDSTLWMGVMGGVSIHNNKGLQKNLTPREGIPSSEIRCIAKAPDGIMWVGTSTGIVRYLADYSHSLRFSKRWLCDNQVNDIAFDTGGNAWVATNGGISIIHRNSMTLAGKERNFYSQLMRRHIREPWTCGVVHLEVAGDTARWRHSDDDNDGEYTGGYLAMESFRYAVTRDEDARLKARKAFDFLCFLQRVTGTRGFFARSVVPPGWPSVHDPNRQYDEKQLAEHLVNDPRFKPVTQRWHKSADGKWLWKGDTSSDEMDGHMMGYFFYYEYAAGEAERQLIRNQVGIIMDNLMADNYNLLDIDGKHTRWGVWSPDQLNRDPDWASEKSLNSFELLAYLKFAAHITGDARYEKEYLRLIRQEGYLDNAAKLNTKNPAWQIYFDRTLEGYLFPILVRYETDPELKKFWNSLMDEWMKNQPAGENLINNLTYAIASGKKVNTQQTIDFLRDAPLDLVDWTIDHTQREDVRLVRQPILEEIQVSELPPASERGTVRWDKNPWSAVSGDPHQEREPVFWLWPYWMARYLGILSDER